MIHIVLPFPFLKELMMGFIHVLSFNHYLMINKFIYSSQIFLNLQSWIQLSTFLFMFYKHLQFRLLPRPAPPMYFSIVINWQAPPSTQLAKPGFCELSLTPEFLSSAFSNNLLPSFWEKLLVQAGFYVVHYSNSLLYFWTQW